MLHNTRFALNAVSRRKVLKAALATAFCTTSLTPFKRVPAASNSPVGLALCIGLNEVDPRAYAGWRGTLRGCIPDSQVMSELARSQNFYDVKVLNNQDATIENVRRYIAWAANDLRGGDTFLISCSSHGAYRRDTQGDEVDGRDETWCLWNGQWADDDRYQLWKRFAPRVRIIVVADMCHSGTTAKVLQSLDEMVRAASFKRESIALQELSRGIRSRGTRSAPPTDFVQPRDIPNDFAPKVTDSLQSYAKNLQKLDGASDSPDPEDSEFGTSFNFDEPSPIRAMPDALAEFLSETTKDDYATSGVPRSAPDVRATGLLLAACQDSQTALDGARNGVFTNALSTVWNRGQFQGSYETFYRTIQQLLRNYPSHQPNMELFGAPEGRFSTERPFQIQT